MTNLAQTERIFDGVKFFWRTRTTIDILIVKHLAQNVIEIITYEPIIDKEADRIYIDAEVLSARIDTSVVDEQVSFALRNQIALNEEFVHGLTKTLEADYILERFFITNYDIEKSILNVAVQFTNCDMTNPEVKLLFCAKPDELIPHEVEHFGILGEGVFDEAAAKLTAELSNVNADLIKASTFAKKVVAPMSYRERWRSALVFVKVAQKRVLNTTDALVWSKATGNIRGARYAALMLAELDPDVNKGNEAGVTVSLMPVLTLQQIVSGITAQNSTFKAETLKARVRLQTLKKPKAAKPLPFTHTMYRAKVSAEETSARRANSSTGSGSGASDDERSSHRNHKHKKAHNPYENVKSVVTGHVVSGGGGSHSSKSTVTIPTYAPANYDKITASIPGHKIHKHKKKRSNSDKSTSEQDSTDLGDGDGSDGEDDTPLVNTLTTEANSNDDAQLDTANALKFTLKVPPSGDSSSTAPPMKSIMKPQGASFKRTYLETIMGSPHTPMPQPDGGTSNKSTGSSILGGVLGVLGGVVGWSTHSKVGVDCASPQ